MDDPTAQGRVPQWDLSDRMRKTLRDSAITSSAMAGYLGVTPGTVSRWLTGRTQPSTAALRAWATRTGVSYDWLAGGDCPRPGRGWQAAVTPAVALVLLAASWAGGVIP